MDKTSHPRMKTTGSVLLLVRWAVGSRVGEGRHTENSSSSSSCYIEISSTSNALDESTGWVGLGKQAEKSSSSKKSKTFRSVLCPI